MNASRLFALVHPPLLALAWTLSTYLATGTPAWALWRPAAIVVVLAVAVQIAVSVVLRRPSIAALVASIVMLSLAASWTLALPLAGVLAWWLVINLLRGRRQQGRVGAAFLEQFSSGIGIVSIVLIGLLGWQTAQTIEPPSGEHALPEERSTDLSDIYIVLLDGYPRADDLASRFGIDIGPFIAELEGRGFDVHEESRSNYTSTWATLASMFHATYLDEIESLAGISTTGPDQYRALGRLVNDSPLLAALRRSGYRIVASPSPYSEVTLYRSGQLLETIGPTWFEEQLLEKSVAATVLNTLLPDLFASQQRARIANGLSRMAEAGDHGDEPVFFFDHILTPHPPFVFTQSGAARSLPMCFPRECSLWAPSLARLDVTKAEYGSAMAGHLSYVNSQLLDSIDALIDAQPNAVIAVFGDHATRYDTAGDPDEATLNFMATRTPGSPRLFGEDLSPVNLLSGLLNRYLGTNFPQVPFKAWLSTGSSPLPMEPVR